MREKESRAQSCHGIFLSFFHFPQALCCCISCCVLLTEEMLIHGSELQETLFPGEETSWGCCQPAPWPVSATCPSPEPAPGLTEKG